MDGPRPVRSKSVTLLEPTDNQGYELQGKKAGLYGTKSSLRSQAAAAANDESDEDLAQTTPMMPSKIGHREAARSLTHLTGENSYLGVSRDANMDQFGPPQPIAPTGTLAWMGFGLSVFALASMCISFASPYWLQQWELSFNTFENMGLWEACFHNYMHHRDDQQQIYNGCFWVYNADEKYNKLRDWLVPPWFISCQVLSTIVLVVLIAVVIVMALVFLHMCPMMNHEYHQIFAMFIAGALLFMCTMTSLIVAILFGVQINDRHWMPRPDWNMLSWGYGFLIICSLFCLVAGLALFVAAWKAYNELLRHQDQYFKEAMDMQASGYAPSGYAASQASYGADYGEKADYSNQPSYQSQQSTEKDAYGKSGLGTSQSSFGGGKAQYAAQQSYDSSRGRQQAAEMPPTYNGAQGYDGDHSYDSHGEPGYDQRAGYSQFPQPYAQGSGYGYNQYGQPRA